ncbi:hypothetical protein B0H14DRAFT_3462757 [Mycena olivaceomarginata]|nr:hypothetical protein B0H14DRAFT_3462757 [Mycena olivaceomarginata]
MSQDSAALSLLSLSIAASNAQPIPLNEQSSKHPGALSHHRRLSSTGRRRRLSDARDAASRPLSVGSPGLSMAALTLSTSASPPSSAVAHAMPASAPAKSSTPIPIAQPATAAAGARKKRGVDHKCEACSKIYRHPSCLIKHRWEHTPHWRTLSSLPHPGPGGSAGPLLEAAAILSHLSPDSETGTSLPEDRGMWPRWVSGGALEGEDDVPGSVPASVSSAHGTPPRSAAADTRSAGAANTGAPARARMGSAAAARARARGPRLHDYEVPRGAEVAQRAGVVEVPNARAQGHAHYTRHAHAHSGSVGGAGSVGGSVGGGAWSVPRSVSVSASVSSEQSRSRSTPSDDEEEEDDEDQGAGRGRAGARVWRREEEFDLGLRGVKEEGEEEYDEYGDEFDDGKEKERGRRTGESLRATRIARAMRMRTAGSVGAGTGVQLLEAAAILSHLSPDSETGTSLPEDRGMWPRWVSGGALEGEDDVPGSVPASVSSACGYPSSVGGDGYSGGGGSEYGSAGWRGMCQCTIAYTSDPPRPVPRRRGYVARSLPAPIGIPADSPRRPHEVSAARLEGEDDVPASVPASVSSAYGYPSPVGGGGYSGGGGSEYGSAGWRGMRQCTIAYTSDPPRPVPRRRGYAARSLPAPIGIPADSPRRPHELTVRPALSPRRFEGRVGSTRPECPPFAQGSAWRSASPVVSSYVRAPTSAPPHTPPTQESSLCASPYTGVSSHSNLPLPQLSTPFSFWVSPSQYTIITKSADTHAEGIHKLRRARLGAGLNLGRTVSSGSSSESGKWKLCRFFNSQNDGAVVTEYVKECQEF